MSDPSRGALGRVLPMGPVSTGALFWRSAGELQLTVIAQARFRLEHERPMASLEPRPLDAIDRHQENDATRSLLAASDVVPFRPRVDVWMTGHAVAPSGVPTAAMAVRLAIYRSGASLLDRVVNVYGDRGAPNDAPAPFHRVPLVYERARGGPGFDPNPVGCGLDERGRAPNLMDALRPEAPASFGPVSRYWKARRRWVTSEQRRDLDRPIPVVVSGFDWRYFQAAPPEQQLERLMGDEWVVLDGVDASLPRIQSYLPNVYGVARLFTGASPFGEMVALTPDTLAVDADAKEVRVTWRGLIRLGGREDLPTLRLAAGVEFGRTSVDWSAVDDQLRAEPPLLASLTPAVAEALAGHGHAGSGRFDHADLGRTDVDFGGWRSTDTLGHTVNGADSVAEPTMKSRVSAILGTGWEQELHGDTLKNVDMAAVRRSVAAGHTLPSGLGPDDTAAHAPLDAIGDATEVGVGDTQTLTMEGLGLLDDES